jgi:RNA polymerase sigma-70 factor, ECF subfamily
MTKPTSPHSDTASKAHWQTSARREQAAFQAAVKPHLQELFEAARRELRYRVALGDFGPDLLTAEELVGETLTRAWRDRHRRPPLLKFRVWLLAVLFRVAEDIARREAQFRKLATESLEAPVPPNRSTTTTNRSGNGTSRTN